MIRILFYLAVIVVVVHFARRFLRSAAKPSVFVTPEGVRVRSRGVQFAMDWRELRQIDVSRVPTSGAADFSVTLFGNSSLTVNSRFLGFEAFAAGMFGRWPDIRTEWLRVLSGPSDISERVTVWKQS